MITSHSGRKMGAMVEYLRIVPAFRQRPFGCSPWRGLPKACLIIAMVVMAGAAICWCRPIQAAGLSEVLPTPVPVGPLSFDESVKIAIHHSPYFTKTSLEIDIKRMDETDSRVGMIPPITFRSYYYINQPVNTGKPYSLSFSADPYNPLGAYFTLQGQKLASQITILKHLEIISKGLENLGQNYLELDALNKLALYQKDLITLAQEKLTFMQNRLSIGTGTSLDVKIAQQELLLVRGEQEQIALTQKRVLSFLMGFLGLESAQQITPDFRDSRRQVLGSYDPTSATLDQAKNRSYELKIIEISKKIQGYNISLAIAKAFPTILFHTVTPDPMTGMTSRGFYAGFGLEIPVWDGFKRIRDVSRQKAVLQQVKAQRLTKENLLEDKWNNSLILIQDKGVALEYARSRENLARLKTQQIEVRYQSGEVQLPEVLDSRKEVSLAQKETVKKSLEYDKAVLAQREISGDLGNSYVDASSWQK